MRLSPLLATLFISLSLLAQEPGQNANMSQIWEAGLPFIASYTPENYKASVQNWCFIQDNRGVMYAGNTSGILEYDGVNWNLIKLPNSSIVRSFAKDDKGRIYIGGVREFGFLEPDSVGQMQFQSLLPELDLKYRNFADVWSTLAGGQEIFFVSHDYIFKWDGTKIKAFESEHPFGSASLIRNQLYVEIHGLGIVKLVNDSLKPIPGGDQLLNKTGVIRTMLPFDDNKILLVHSKEGLFLYDQEEIRPFGNGNVNLLKNKGIYNVITLPNGDYLAITIRNGVYIFDSNGRIKQHLTKKRGLISDVVYGVFSDNKGAVWFGTNNGISKVEMSSPLRAFINLDGLTERVESTCYHLGRLYVATSKELFYLTQPSFEGDDDIFQKVSGIEGRTRSLISAGNNLLIIAQDNVYRIDENNRVYTIKWDTGVAISALRSGIDSTKVYVGSSNGRLLAMHLNRWKLEYMLTIDGEIHAIDENPDGSLWISTQYNGVHKVDFIDGTSDYKITSYDTLAGLPHMTFNFIYRSGDKTYVTTYDSIFYFDEKDQAFRPDTLLLNQFHEEVNAYGYLFFDESGNIWQTVKAGFENRIYHTNNDVLKELKYSRRFADFETYTIDEVGDLMLFVGPKGVVLYNQGLGNKNMTLPEVIIRKVWIKDDSLVFGGQSAREKKQMAELPFRNSQIRFTFALPSYDKPEANQYQYYLEGFNESWSSWSTETQRDFTNLTEGDYRFRVRGRNVYGQVSDEAIYAFTILPPLHRTWWAYFLYFFAGFGMVLLIVRWRSSQLKKEKEALEVIVADRTRQLEKQAEQLKELDQQKSRFFANISHEFRTPLTLIKGPAENALQTQEGEISKNDTLMIRNNADRLLRLVNQLLDLSKLDAKKLSFSPADGNICRFLRAVGSAFSSHAEQRNIVYLVDIPDDDIYASFDHDKLEKVLYNLLSNAFKFCADEGKVTFKAVCANNQLILQVSDNGIGIPEKQLPYIFDRFYQTDDSHTREYEGAGIGLALTKELITLMNGTIDVKSGLNTGTKFTVTIPLEKVIRSQVDDEEKYGHLPSMTPDQAVQVEIHEPKETDKLDTSIILIVEDNPDMRDFIKKQLDDEYSISEATNGKHGLELAQSEIPDLIITDLMMPQMDGMELCEQLKTDERTSHIPVIMLTAKAGHEQKIEGLETGADDYLTKPFDKKELQVRVKNLIAQRQLLIEKFGKEILLEPRKVAITSMDERFLNNVIDLLEENLSHEEFGVPKLQDALAMSKTQLHRKMKALTDQAPGEFIRHYRLQRAAQILSDQGGNVTEVAFAVGFGSLSYFTRSFKEYYQKSPSEYAAQKSK